MVLLLHVATAGGPFSRMHSAGCEQGWGSRKVLLTRSGCWVASGGLCLSTGLLGLPASMVVWCRLMSCVEAGLCSGGWF